jgi:methylmalonyl-CoA mutase N-terminal domain/subunit
MPPIREAVRGDCTLGEISGALESVFGRYNPALST